jgi:hypothetical protein
MVQRKPSAVFDKLLELINLIEAQPDPLARLAAYSYLSEEYRKKVIPSRDKAAYEARLQYIGSDISSLAGIEVKDVYRYADQHRERSGSPRIPKTQRTDLSHARQLVAALGVERGRDAR